MILFIDIFVLAIAIGLLLPIGVLFVECSAALLPDRVKVEDRGGYQPQTVILVPAHNEASGIGATLETLLPQLTDSERLVVIADNCTDETAAIARALGVTVLERHDRDRTGKGYALDYGLRAIEPNPPEVVVVIDADCIVEKGTIQRIARQAMTLSRPVQAIYLMAQPPNPKPKDAVSALAFLVKNLVRPKGLARLGLPCLLTGTGMAFPWSVIKEASLASSNIVEDMQLSVELAIKGQAPVFCFEAKVTSVFPQQEQAAKSQRTRWEHGHLQTLLTQAPKLLQASVHQKRFDLLGMALDLSVPPLSLLVMLWIAAILVSSLARILGATWIPAIVLAVEGLLILISIFGAWVQFGRADVSLTALLAVPFYVLWKIPLYVAFLLRPQREWMRTERDTVDT
ncbi:MAG TPA: glycosyl transferase [Cyanobacteria bacterium UBA8803]|nr:glycosyl transferase [Cyanobacteria bacterium UBA9273]HBL57842.1 glycosyl transferase [Cyanobacteria bacterium UBA8803]